jgi:hypothetical protein
MNGPAKCRSPLELERLETVSRMKWVGIVVSFLLAQIPSGSLTRNDRRGRRPAVVAGLSTGDRPDHADAS